MFFVSLDEKNIKVKQNYIFSHVFNIGRLQKSNIASSQVGKVSNFKPHIGNLNFNQTTSE